MPMCKNQKKPWYPRKKAVCHLGQSEDTANVVSTEETGSAAFDSDSLYTVDSVNSSMVNCVAPNFVELEMRHMRECQCL